MAMFHLLEMRTNIDILKMKSVKLHLALSILYPTDCRIKNGDALEYY